MEALRWIEYLKPGGKMVINDHQIPSVPIQMGVAQYPEGILEELASKADVSVFKASQIAEELGNAKATNIVLLGALVKALDMPHIDWEQAIRDNVKKGYEDLNIQAFRAGAEQV